MEYLVGQIYGGKCISLVAQAVKNLLAIQETQVGSLGQEKTLEKGMATHSSILSCLENSMNREAWWAKELDTTE